MLRITGWAKRHPLTYATAVYAVGVIIFAWIVLVAFPVKHMHNEMRALWIFGMPVTTAVGAFLKVKRQAESRTDS